eukprot:scaffold16252_cov79-Skeletonema_dohrnii-CCMP3373.AAC.4
MLLEYYYTAAPIVSVLCEGTSVERKKAVELSANWFKEKSWSISGNKAYASKHLALTNTIICPKSTQDVAEILASNQEAAVAVVCGSHSSSNVATWACFSEAADKDDSCQDDNTIILDMKNMTSVTVDNESMEVTVGGGSIFRQLAQVCADAGGALPIGTGDTVGVCGYTMNGWLSGYFGKRLGMLGQRVVHIEIVLANGTVNLSWSRVSNGSSYLVDL